MGDLEKNVASEEPSKTTLHLMKNQGKEQLYLTQ